MAKHANSVTQAVIDFVKTHPGCDSTTLINGLPQTAKSGAIHASVLRLKRGGVLENRGGNNRFYPAEYHFVEPNASKNSCELARGIYTEMLNMHHSGREAFLAAKLEELLN